MGCNTCKAECGREDGCGTRKAEQKDLLDRIVARLYPRRTWGEPDDEASFRAGPREAEVQILSRSLSVALKAPTYLRPGGPEDLCRYIYVLCLGREPPLLRVREEGLGLLAIAGEAPSELAVSERYLRLCLSTLGRLACVQEVALELVTSPSRAPDGMAMIKELPLPGVFDPKLLKRFQKAVDLLAAHEIVHLDMGLLDVPAERFDLLPGTYADRYGAAPALLNFLFYAQPVSTATATFLPLLERAAAFDHRLERGATSRS